MAKRGSRIHARLMCGAAGAALLLWAGAAQAQTAAKVDIAPQPLASALNEFGVQTGRQVIFAPALAGSKATRGVSATGDIELALAQLLEGSGLSFRRSDDTFLIVRADSPQSGSAAGGGAEVEALIVTAQKREEDIQDVPIAISAFSQEDLTRSQVAGGPDLMTQVPNMTFTKTNFSSYSIQLRGIGTQAISATTDAAVAVAFNNTPFIRNHFFEQEFYDLQRVEVLRGPQGTLYGRNATAGVVNVISARPKFVFESKLSGDVANYKSTRLEGMVNIPLVEDAVALRLAAAWTKRNGYVTNEITGNPIDGRDLWSTRVSLRLTPNDAVDVNLLWEHFEEDDDRLRSGKQVCKKAVVDNIAGFDVGYYDVLPERGQPVLWSGVQATFSQGCAPASIYADESFQTPNGLSLPYYVPLGAIGLPITGGGLGAHDPYVSTEQSRDLRVIESTVDPNYRAKNDLGELQISIDVSDGLTLTSETAYSADSLFSMQDYNRFNTAPGAWENTTSRPGVLTPGPNGGIFCDPQIGCSDRVVAIDVSEAKSRQFSQELRLGSDFDGPFNFSLGANWLRFDNEDKYYVFINSLSLIAAIKGNSTPYVGGVTDNYECLPRGFRPPDPNLIQDVSGCVYMDNNPIGALNDQGHNYFLSRNPYKLISYAVFGEAYYNLTDNLKITTGLRWTVDKKQAPRIPSWVLAGKTAGYPVTDVIDQEWSEPTGRLAIDWKPDLGFTDQTLLYASFAHGYKAGGANPPPAGPVMYCSDCQTNDLVNAVVADSATHPKSFDAEFVNAYELGAKNTFADGRLTVNLAAFYYDYTGYQISQIVNRSAINRNFDAKIWGLEIEADWRPVENLRLGFKGGYEDTRVADGEKAVDLMDRTAGHDDWVVVRPFPTFSNNCILPVELFVGIGDGLNGGNGPQLQPINLGGVGGGNPGACELAYVLGYDPVTAAPYVDLTTVTGPIAEGNLSTLPNHPGYQGWNPATAPNHGEGFDTDLSGNSLPNAPHYTATITADYTLLLPNDWLATLHADLYYQSEAWTRIFNLEGYDKLKAYTNLNLAAIFTNEERGWTVMAYVKNVMDRDSITGAFLNSDDTGLTTNVFLTEPRLYGLRVTKAWSGGALLGSFGERHEGPYPLTLELGGQIQHNDAPSEHLAPEFVGLFSSDIDPVAVQDSDLDTGDGRAARLTWRPTGSPWRISAAVRYGRTNTDVNRRHQEEVAGPKVCVFPADFQGGTFANRICDPDYVIPGYEQYGPGYLYSPNAVAQPINWTDSSSRRHEEHTIADFTVGRDAGIGMFGDGSSVSLGLRYANIKSTADAWMHGVTDWEIPDGFLFYEASFSGDTADLRAEREFKGVGPIVSWEAAHRVFGDDRAHADLEWSLSGGVLFGKQKTTVDGPVQAGDWQGYYYGGGPRNLTLTVDDELAVRRSRSVTVPVFDASLGLSYQIDRMKIGAGYKWERYSDVLDAGFMEAKDADRTIDGPYFKIAVGFGG